MAVEEIVIQKTINILFLGDSSSGKTELWRQLRGLSFESNYCPTIGIDYFELGSNEYRVLIFDTAESSRFDAIKIKYEKKADVSIYCMDLSNLELNIAKIEADIRKQKALSPTCQIILAGTKADLCESMGVDAQSQLDKIDTLDEVRKLITSSRLDHGVNNKGGLRDILMELIKNEKNNEKRASASSSLAFFSEALAPVATQGSSPGKSCMLL